MTYSYRPFVFVVLFAVLSGCSQGVSNSGDASSQLAAVADGTAVANVDGNQSGNAEDLITKVAAAQKTYAAESTAGQAYDAATLLTDEDIREITGHAVAEKTPGPAMGIFPNGCRWKLEGGKLGASPEIVLGAMSPGGRRYFDTYLNLDKPPAVAGLGDIAVSELRGCIIAVKGDTLVNLQYIEFSAAEQDICKKLIERIFSRLH